MSSPKVGKLPHITCQALLILCLPQPLLQKLSLIQLWWGRDSHFGIGGQFLHSLHLHLGQVMVLNIIRVSVVVASGTQPSDHCECCCSNLESSPFWGSTHPQITGLTTRAQKPASSHQPQILARVWWQGKGPLQISVTAWGGWGYCVSPRQTPKT